MKSTAYSGQHRDQGEHGEGEALRHVELERLGRPGEEEGRAEDGEAEDERRHDVAEADPGRPGRSRRGPWPGPPAPGPGPGLAGPGAPAGVLSGAVGVTRPILRGGFPGLPDPTDRPRADDPPTREHRMNSQEQGKNSRSSPCWMRFTGPLPGAEARKHETDDQPLAPIRPLSGRRSRALLPAVRSDDGSLEAKAICAVCPVREPCLEHAITAPREAGRVGRPRRAGTSPPRPPAPQDRLNAGADSTLGRTLRAALAGVVPGSIRRMDPALWPDVIGRLLRREDLPDDLIEQAMSVDPLG